MKPAILVGILLLVIGAVAFTYQGITWTTREQVAEIGPLHITADRKRTLPLTPIVGALALIGGLGLLLYGAKRT